jgi:hypothetical protein
MRRCFAVILSVLLPVLCLAIAVMWVSSFRTVDQWR